MEKPCTGNKFINCNLNSDKVDITQESCSNVSINYCDPCNSVNSTCILVRTDTISQRWKKSSVFSRLANYLQNPTKFCISDVICPAQLFDNDFT